MICHPVSTASQTLCSFINAPVSSSLVLRVEYDNITFFEPTCPKLILYWLESPGISHLCCILPKKIHVEEGKKEKWRLNYESADIPPEVTAHWGNSSLSFQHQHLSSRSESFLWLNIKRRQWCQGESNQWSIFWPGGRRSLQSAKQKQISNQSLWETALIIMRLHRSRQFNIISLSALFAPKIDE